jgi:NAD dependent epimerase/dehydratase family enzyme
MAALPQTQPQSGPVEVSSPEFVLERRALTWPDRAREITVKDQESYDRAAESLKAIKELRAEIEDTFGPVVKRAYETHRAAVAARKKVEEPLEQAERILKGSIGIYSQEQERKRLEEQRRLQEEAEARAAAEREQEIEDAEAAGADAVEVRTIAERALNVAPVIAPPTVQQAAGIGQRDNWKAQVIDLKLLVAFVAKNPQFLNLVEPNQVAINTMARGLKSAMAIPGIKVWNEPSVSVRR